MSLELLTKYERDLWNKGLKYIAGVDEVGRGCLAGPMVVSAVIINKEHVSDYNNLLDEHKLYEEIKDSKKLSAIKRDKLSIFITNESITYSIVEIPHSDIDRYGISKCTQIGFYESVKKLTKIPHHILTDAYEIEDIAHQSQTNITRGDNLSLSIAAASIVAKVYRDNLMVDLHESSDKYKVYRFDKHKGYGTAFHREMIKKYGYSDIHRKSYHLK